MERFREGLVDLTRPPLVDLVDPIKSVLANRRVVVIAGGGRQFMMDARPSLFLETAFRDPILTFRPEDIAGTVEEMIRRMQDLVNSINSINQKQTQVGYPARMDHVPVGVSLRPGFLMVDLGVTPREPANRCLLERTMKVVIYPNTRIAATQALRLISSCFTAKPIDYPIFGEDLFESFDSIKVMPESRGYYEVGLLPFLPPQ